MNIARIGLFSETLSFNESIVIVFNCYLFVYVFFLTPSHHPDNLMEECKNEVNNPNNHVRCGYCSLLGDLPSDLLKRIDHGKQEALKLLCQHALYYPHLAGNPQALLENIQPPLLASTVEERRDAVKALIK